MHKELGNALLSPKPVTDGKWSVCGARRYNKVSGTGYSYAKKMKERSCFKNRQQDEDSWLPAFALATAFLSESEPSSANKVPSCDNLSAGSEKGF